MARVREVDDEAMTVRVRHRVGVVLALSVALAAASSPEGGSVDAAALPIRPDAQIRLYDDFVGSPPGTFIGNNIYNRTGTGQSLFGMGRNMYQVKVQNDGRFGSFRIKGTPNTGTCPITYLYKGRIVSDAVAAGTFSMNRMAHRESRRLKVHVYSSTVIGYTCRAEVTVISKSDGRKRDTVVAEVI
jgi:hypothetical protein